MNPILVTKISLVSVVLIILGFFIFNNSKIFFAGPQIEIISPKNGSAFDFPLIEIKGNAKNISFVSLDDYPIFIDEEGNFSEKLLLNPGISIIKLYARDKFERESKTILQYMYTGTSTSISEIKIEPVTEEAEDTATTTQENPDESE